MVSTLPKWNDSGQWSQVELGHSQISSLGFSDSHLDRTLSLLITAKELSCLFVHLLNEYSSLYALWGTLVVFDADNNLVMFDAEDLVLIW